MASWQELTPPSFTANAQLRFTADGKTFVSIYSSSGVDNQIQLYDVASDTWNTARTISHTYLGGFDIEAVGVVQGGKILLLSAVAGATPVHVVSMDTTSGALSAYGYSVDRISSPQLDQPYYTPFSFYWFSNNPSFMGLFYSVAGATTVGLLCFDIASAAPVGLITFPATSLSPGAVEANNSVASGFAPQGKIWGGSDGGGSNGLIGDIGSLLSANAFSGAPMTTVTFINGGGTGVPETISVPHISIASLTPTACDTFQTTLAAAALGNAGCGPASYTSFSNFTGTTYDVTMQPFNLTAETLGTPVTLTTPAGFYADGLVTAYIGGGLGSAATAYIQSTNTFYKMLTGSPSPPPTGIQCQIIGAGGL